MHGPLAPHRTLGLAERRRRGGVDDTRHLGPGSGAHGSARALDVGLHHRGRVLDAQRVHAGHVEDHLAALHPGRHGVLVEHIATCNPGSEPREDGLGLRGAGEGHDVVASRQQPLDERAADEAAAPGDEHAAHVSPRSEDEKRTK